MVEQKYYPYDEHDCGLTFISEIGDLHGTAWSYIVDRLQSVYKSQ